MILPVLLLLLSLLITGKMCQRSSLIHPASPSVNSLAYLNSSSEKMFTLSANLSSCNFFSGPIPCECLQTPGEYTLRQNRTEIIRFTVSAPRISISLPRSHPLLHSLTVRIKPKLCIARKHQVQLWFRSLDIMPDAEDPWLMVADRKVILKDVETPVTFPCENLVRAGIYRIHVVGPMNVTVQSETTVMVNSSEDTSLRLRSDSIFPHCSDDYTVQWTLARCAVPSLVYRLRVLAVPEGNINHLEDRAIYVEEIGLEAGQTAIALMCSQFDIIFDKYCFELVSLETNSSQFHLWHSKCVNTEPVESIDGGWSPWSSWSSCFGNCGRGSRTRTRTCDNPAPIRGKACMGDVIEREQCALHPCPDRVDSRAYTYSNCSCGCVLQGTTGSFFAAGRSVGEGIERPTHPRCRGNSSWTLPHKGGSVVDLVILSQPKTKEKMFIYQGEPYKNLIWRSDGRGETSFTVHLSSPLHFVLVPIQEEGHEKNSGFTVVYSLRPLSSPLPVRSHMECHPVCPQTMVIGALSVIFILLIFIPPFVCAKITQKMKRNSSPELPLIDKCGESEMIRSGNTECTQISGAKYVAKRSIGIQLSVHSTPRVIRSVDSPARNASSLSVSDELEYDYYDGTVEPGSLLAPPLLAPAFSTIDIDQIIAEARRVIDHVDTSDAHTQINQ